MPEGAEPLRDLPQKNYFHGTGFDTLLREALVLSKYPIMPQLTAECAEQCLKSFRNAVADWSDPAGNRNHHQLDRSPNFILSGRTIDGSKVVYGPTRCPVDVDANKRLHVARGRTPALHELTVLMEETRDRREIWEQVTYYMPLVPT